MLKVNTMRCKTKFIFHKISYLFGAALLHLLLVKLFSSNFYFFYFFTLFISAYILHLYIIHFSKILFFSFTFLALLVVQTSYYDHSIFIYHLYMDDFEGAIYSDMVVVYILSFLHLLILTLLERFDTMRDNFFKV